MYEANIITYYVLQSARVVTSCGLCKLIMLLIDALIIIYIRVLTRFKIFSAVP